MFILLFLLWSIAIACLLWLLPELFVYGLARFMTTYFGGDAPRFPLWYTLATAFMLSAAVTCTVAIVSL